MTENFLLRWSRRKQAATQAAEPAKSAPRPESAVAQHDAAGPREPQSRNTSGAAQNAPDPGAPALDSTSLPAIEAITAATDIRAFLAAGVPAELTRAALRRAWTSDPKIRDFVGLADYDWDFNTPGSMAGFGPLEGADALRVQAARWVGPGDAQDGAFQAGAAQGGAAEVSEHRIGAEQSVAASDASVCDRPGQTTKIIGGDEPSPKIDASQERDELAQPERNHTAMQQQQENPEDVQSIARRRRGGALPYS
jgi:Protein of unknown function (DUF3306)